MEAKSTPSQFREKFGEFLGKRIIKMVRYSWWPKEDTPSECEIADELCFSLTAGPLEVTFEDQSSLGVFYEPSLNSIVVWAERKSGGCACDEFSMAEDVELYPISANDDRYCSESWRDLLGRKLIGFSVLKHRVMNSLQNELPSESGLRFILEGESCFITSRGLDIGSDDFSVLLPSQLTDWHMNQLVEIQL